MTTTPGAHPPRDDGEQPDGQAAQPVEEPAFLVVRHAAGCAHALEQHARDDEARHQEVHIGKTPRVTDRTAEDIAEDEQEEQPLRGAGDQQCR
jgi:hypothetical protein